MPSALTYLETYFVFCFGRKMSEIKSKLSSWFGNSFVTDKVLKNCAKESESLPAYAV